MNGVQGVKVTRPSLLYMLSPAELSSTALVSVSVSVGRGRMLKEKPGSVQAARGLLGFVRFFEQVAQM